MLIHGFAGNSPIGTFFRENRPYPEFHVEAATGAVLELSLPLEAVRLSPNVNLEFFVDLMEAGSSVDRLPREGLITLKVPSTDFEAIMWQA